MVSPESKWSTRYGTQYRRLCARPGCSAPAVATLRFQSTERLAWLVELDDNSARTQGDLCNRHAAALVLPRGWELHDERELQATAADAPAAVAGAPAAGTTRRTRTRRKPADRSATPASQLPGLDPASGSGAVHEPEPEPDAVAAGEPTETTEVAEVTAGSGPRGVPAQFGTSEDTEVVDDELDEILDARTPLLRRAFRNAKPN